MRFSDSICKIKWVTFKAGLFNMKFTFYASRKRTKPLQRDSNAKWEIGTEKQITLEDVY